MMKGKVIAILSAVAITAGSMGVVAFAANTDTGAAAPETAVQTSKNEGYGPYNGSAALSQGDRQNMIDIMRDNGFQDAAQYMQTGDYDKMDDFMNNLSEEDYQKMIDLMRSNGYGSMAQMMESVGREGMIEMHNSMGGNYGHGTGMMDGFSSID